VAPVTFQLIFSGTAGVSYFVVPLAQRGCWTIVKLTICAPPWPVPLPFPVAVPVPVLLPGPGGSPFLPASALADAWAATGCCAGAAPSAFFSPNETSQAVIDRTATMPPSAIAPTRTALLISASAYRFPVAKDVMGHGPSRDHTFVPPQAYPGWRIQRWAGVPLQPYC
jgi:hypothetical protein